MCYMETAVLIVLGFAGGALILVEPSFFLFMFAGVICFEMITLIMLSVKTMIDRFSCKHNESNVNNDNEHDDYVEDDTDLSMMLFQKEN
mgnify:CR=1 FL=1